MLFVAAIILAGLSGIILGDLPVWKIVLGAFCAGTSGGLLIFHMQKLGIR